MIVQKNIIKKNKPEKENKKEIFDIELTSLLLTYEVAKSDGEVSKDEESHIKKRINDKGFELSLFKDIKDYSDNSSSFYELIKDINTHCSHDEKIYVIKNLWDIAFSDGQLATHEERIIRRVADMINIKDIRVLKLKHDSKFNN